ncbi:MAG: DUF3373 family protein [Terriglobia bacterium]|nr:DUF3373 family protein [Terriglobia bacterium]
MRRIITVFLLLCVCGATMLFAQESGSTPPDIVTRQQQEIEQLQKMVADLKARLDAQEQSKQQQQPQATQQAQIDTTAAKAASSTEELTNSVRDLERRMLTRERDAALSKVRFSGDYRFEAHSIWGNIPSYYDGMRLQNLMVKTLFAATPTSAGGLGMPFDQSIMSNYTPQQYASMLDTLINRNYSAYQAYTNQLTFNDLKQAVGNMPQQQVSSLMNYLQGATYVPRYQNDTSILYTNRLRLKLDSKIADNLSVTARLSMYKAWGDSSGVQIFDGQANSLSIDGNTVTVPNSDMLRVERAFFTWSKIAHTGLYLSIGRRPSTGGPPMNYREDEPRGGTPSGALIDFQFDGITAGYRVNDHTELRICYGVGYQSGFGNGDILELPQDRLKNATFLGGNFDLYDSESTFLQLTVARAFNVTDGFTGLTVLPNNPITGDPISAPVIMRYTPSANLGDINLIGLNFTHRFGPVDAFVSGNYSGLRPNLVTTPFGGLGSDPFETPVNHDGAMIYVGARYSLPQNDGRTKFGFEFNHGSKYWFNFAQAQDDIISPKTNTRGNVYETYLTHRIKSRFILKVDYIKYFYDYSGSGWHIGAPKALDSTPVLGFPTYDRASMLSLGLTTRF